MTSLMSQAFCVEGLVSIAKPIGRSKRRSARLRNSGSRAIQKMCVRFWRRCLRRPAGPKTSRRSRISYEQRSTLGVGTSKKETAITKGGDMPWFAAHVLLYFEVAPSADGPVSVMENVYLIEADDEDTARRKAEERGRADCGDDSGTLRIEGRAAELRYGGIRKLISPRRSAERLIQSPDEPVDLLEDGTEATYSRFVVSNREDLKMLMSGQPVSVLYKE